ncbi:MAG: SpoIVB peptidase S55 domain-containing protein [Atribacterota bacterium]|nr:SpoIVB peptidase S55 domain-containing protein [Atribacterota bacterium]
MNKIVNHKITEKKKLFLFCGLFHIFLLILFINGIIIICAKPHNIIPVSEILPGMTGIGKTVFSGLEIEEFEVTVIDIIAGTEINEDYILVQLSGNNIDKNGGISAGMSGSPVYFGKRLAGAVSHAWEMSEHNLCLITPIENMLPMLEGFKQQKTETDTDYEFQKDILIPFDDNFPKEIFEDYISKKDLTGYISKKLWANFKPIKTPLIITGFTGRSQDIFKQYFSKQNLNLINNNQIFPAMENIKSLEFEAVDPQPGSAIGVQLSTGDASVLAIGTATYCYDNLVLALGHPFMHTGDASFLFSAVYIYHSFPNIIMPFKIGAPYQLLGEVVQDRSSGILARVGYYPKIVSCKISITDLDREKYKESGAKIIPQGNIVQSITNALIIQSIDSAIDRIGSGTATVKIELKTSVPNSLFIHKNIFFSKDDIATQCINDFNEIIDLVVNNYCEIISLSEIKVHVDITEENQSAILKEMEIDKKEYSPGEKIEIKLKLKPFRRPEEEKIVELTISEDLDEGEFVLIVKGGFSDENSLEQMISQNNDKYLLNGWEEIKNDFEKRVKNNQIIAELIPLNKHERQDLNWEDNSEPEEKEIKELLDTNYIVEGQHEIYLSVINYNNKNIENSDKEGRSNNNE